MHRMAKAVVSTLIAWLAVTAACAAQQDVLLAFKFAPGDVIQYEVLIAGSASFNAIGDRITPMTLQGNLSVKQTVTEVFPDGSGRIEIRIPRGDLTVSLDKDQVRFSYANGELRWFANGKESAMPNQAELSKVPFIGTPVFYTMAPDGRISDAALADPGLMSELAKALSGLNLSLAQPRSEPIFPPQPVKVGETWRKTTSVMPLGPGHPVTVTVSRTLDSYDDAGGFGLAKIIGFAEMRLGGGPATALPGQDVSISVSNIRQTVNSTEFFGTATGQLMRGDYDITFSTQVAAKAGVETRNAGIDARLRVNVQSR